MRAARQPRSGSTLPALEADRVDLCPAGAHGAGGSRRALREHLGHVEAELREVRGRIRALEEAVVCAPSRPLQHLLNPSNLLQSAGPGTAVVRIHSSRSSRAEPAWLRAWQALCGLPWPQLLALLGLAVLLMGLGLLLKKVMG